MRVAVLVGAGASYGAGKGFNRQPPLGWALFPELTDAFPGTWGEVPEHHLFEQNFEAGMAEVWGTLRADIVQLLLDMGLYFTQFRVVQNSDNAYVQLLHLLRDHGLLPSTTFASLNYETLLEQSAASTGMGVHEVPKRGHKDCVTILKPHGSSHYFPAGNIVYDNVRVSYSESYYDGPIAPEDWSGSLRRYSQNFPPAMSLYAAGKHSPVGQSFLAGVREQWRIAVMASDLILTIGVHPNMEDGHVWAPILTGSRSPVWYIGGRAPEDPYLEAVSVLGSRFAHVAETFDQGLVELADKLEKGQHVRTPSRSRR